jgi:hypothetical protein
VAKTYDDGDVPYLQDAHNAARMAEIDRRGVELLPAWRSRLLRRIAGAKVSGQLGEIDGHPTAVYLAGGRLWLTIDGQPWHLDEVDADVDVADRQYAIAIRTPQHNYEFVVESRGLEDDTTPFVDLEDFSFGLWAARIIRDPDRQQVLRDTLQDASLGAMPEHAAETARG